MSLELKNVEYASELSSQLLKHGEDLEKTYMALQKAIVDKDEKSLQKLLKDLEAKDQWFAKAEAGGSLHSPWFKRCSHPKLASHSCWRKYL